MKRNIPSDMMQGMDVCAELFREVIRNARVKYGDDLDMVGALEYMLVLLPAVFKGGEKNDVLHELRSHL